jgi:VWFA-related protein
VNADGLPTRYRTPSLRQAGVEPVEFRDVSHRRQLGDIDDTMRWCCCFAIALAALAQEPEPPIRVYVNLVPVTFLATDLNGAPIRDLQRSDLKLTDDQRPRDISFLGRESGLPLTVGLVVDMSASQWRFFARHREDIRTFIKNVLQPGDRAFLMSFGIRNQVRLVTDVTGSAEELGRGVEALKGCGRSLNPFACSSPIWSAVFTAARSNMKNVTGRKALVLLSDGVDTGGPHTLTDAIEAAQDADAAVYTMMSKFAVTPVALLESRKAQPKMQRLAQETGGRYFDSSKKDSAAGIFAQIEEELRNLYVVGFSIPETDRDGKFHQLQVETTRAGVKIRARKGYIASR